MYSFILALMLLSPTLGWSMEDHEQGPSTSASRSASDPARWEALSDEVLAHIFSFLNYKDIATTQQTCHQWRNVGNDLLPFKVLQDVTETSNEGLREIADFVNPSQQPTAGGTPTTPLGKIFKCTRQAWEKVVLNPNVRPLKQAEKDSFLQSQVLLGTVMTDIQRTHKQNDPFFATDPVLTAELKKYNDFVHSAPFQKSLEENPTPPAPTPPAADASTSSSQQAGRPKDLPQVWSNLFLHEGDMDEEARRKMDDATTWQTYQMPDKFIPLWQEAIRSLSLVGTINVVMLLVQEKIGLPIVKFFYKFYARHKNLDPNSPTAQHTCWLISRGLNPLIATLVPMGIYKGICFWDERDAYKAFRTAQQNYHNLGIRGIRPSSHTQISPQQIKYKTRGMQYKILHYRNWTWQTWIPPLATCLLNTALMETNRFCQWKVYDLIKTHKDKIPVQERKEFRQLANTLSFWSTQRDAYGNRYQLGRNEFEWLSDQDVYHQRKASLYYQYLSRHKLFAGPITRWAKALTASFIVTGVISFVQVTTLMVFAEESKHRF